MKIEELHQQFTDYGKNAKEWMRKCILLLPEIAKYEVWKEKGFSCIYEYAAKLAGMSRGQVDEALYILRKIEDKPALLKVVAQKGLNSVRPIVAIATYEDQEFWADKAEKMSHHTLATYVREFRNVENNNEELQSRNVPKSKIATKTITMQLSEKLADRLEKLKVDQDWETIMTKLVEEFEKSQTKNKEITGKQELPIKEETSCLISKKSAIQGNSHVTKPSIKEKASRHIPAKIKKYVLKRSDNKCEFPDCHKNYNHLHHTNRFSSNRTHDPDQIIALCKGHHDLAHHGLISNENQSPQNWQIRKDPDLTNLNRYIDEQLQFYRRAG